MLIVGNHTCRANNSRIRPIIYAVTAHQRYKVVLRLGYTVGQLWIPFSLQVMEGNCSVSPAALVATVHTRPQVMNNPKPSLSPEAVPGSPHVGSQGKPDEAVIPRPRAQQICRLLKLTCCHHP